ncbi:MAG TPA: hypothetical protein PLQ03_04005 [Brevundimonas sp.]|uniref:hypothetical protein n=1 Tax=Brevundimonas sp. TaxID=1871086 RepID=UPI00260F3104|nr:hypothetical protein [Brevundimonas sp.]HRO32556.1 hypothetical protein [Brevundimonas sp.]
MSRHDRTEIRLAALEAEYRSLLIPALRACAAGRWGLLNDVDPADPVMARLRPPEAEALEALGDRIASLRLTLGVAEAFPLHQRLMHERGLRGDNIPGEPRRARLWLTELGET